MADPDAVKAGGSTGALKRATQMANQRAANAARLAAMLRRRRRPRVPRGGRQLPGGGEGMVLSPPKPPPPPMALPPAPEQVPKNLLGLGLIGDSSAPLAPLPPGPGKPGLGGMSELLPILTNVDAPTATDPKLLNPDGSVAGHLPVGSITPYAAQPTVLPEEINRFGDLNAQQQQEVRKNYKKGNLAVEREKDSVTVNQMLDEVRKDPMASPDVLAAAEELAAGFKEVSRGRFFTNQDLLDNPILGALNDLSVWSQYRRQVGEWKDRKGKAGSASLEENPGDGTFTGLVDNGSFSSVTGPGNLPPYIVARDENGLLYVTTAEKWIQAKYTDMHNDPALAASIITALAAASMYGTDTSANNQRTRVVVDRDGNPVKALVGEEDLAALKDFTLQAAIYQGMGDEVAIDDILAETVALGFDVAGQNGANGEYGGGYGGGGYGYGGGGYGGGGGGGSGAVRYTDATALTSYVSSIARQRMGRELTPVEAAQFVDYYHRLEEQSTAAYYAGQSNTQLDPEGQAIAWITSHFGQTEAAGHQYGNLATTFVQMMGSSQFLPGVS